jgi:hypothetical protein
MVYLTPLSNRALVWAHVFTALYRMRYVYVIVVGLMPFMIVKAFHMYLSVDATTHAYYYHRPSYWDAVGPTLGTLAVVLGLWGMNLLAAAVGVMRALLQRSIGLAVVAAPVMVLMITICPWVCCLATLLTMSPPDLVSLLNCRFLPVTVPLVLMVAPYVLMVIFMEHTDVSWQR